MFKETMLEFLKMIGIALVCIAGFALFLVPMALPGLWGLVAYVVAMFILLFLLAHENVKERKR